MCKVIKCIIEIGGRGMNLALKYLRSEITVDGGLDIEVKFWINDVGKVLGGIKVFSCRAIGMIIKMYEGVAVVCALYRAETLSKAVREDRRLNVMQMMCLMSMYGVTYMDRVRNEDVQRKTGVMKVGRSSRADCVEVV